MCKYHDCADIDDEEVLEEPPVAVCLLLLGVLIGILVWIFSPLFL